MSTSSVDPFWQRVKKLIRAHKLTQEKLASQINISYNTFKGWLQYNRIPDAYTAYDIAVALGVTVEYLVEGVDGKAKEIREKKLITRKAAAANIKKMAIQIRKNAGLIG